VKKLAIYARTSTDKQEKGLEAQERALAEYCKVKGISDYLRFSDEAFSGKLSSRPQFNKMMAAVRAGEIHTVLVYSFSRFARSTKQLIDSLEEFQKLGVAFVSITENIDTTNPYGKFMFTIFASIAQLEREITVERVKNGLKNARAKGKRLGRPPKDRSGERETISSLKAKGASIRAIATQLGIPRATVQRLLSQKPT